MYICKYPRLQQVNIVMEDQKITEYSDFLSLSIVPGMPSLDSKTQEKLVAKLGHGWALVNHHHLQKFYKCKHFSQAVDALCAIREVTQKMPHHPDVNIEVFGELMIKIYTHRINDLTINDFVLAAHINEGLKDFDVPQGYSVRNE